MRDRIDAKQHNTRMRFWPAAVFTMMLTAAGCDSSVDVRAPVLPTVPVQPRDSSSPTVTESRTISGVNGVTLEAVGLVEIHVGATESLTITAPESVMPLLTSDVVGGRLTLGRNSSSYQGQASDIRYDLTLRRLDEVRLIGAGEISVTGVDSDLFIVELSGIGEIRAAGRADRQEVTLTGIGSYLAPDLRSRDTSVHQTSGRIVVWATHRITGLMMAGCILEYWGEPEIAIHSAGTRIGLGAKP